MWIMFSNCYHYNIILQYLNLYACSLHLKNSNIMPIRHNIYIQNQCIIFDLSTISEFKLEYFFSEIKQFKNRQYSSVNRKICRNVAKNARGGNSAAKFSGIKIRRTLNKSFTFAPQDGVRSSAFTICRADI